MLAFNSIETSEVVEAYRKQTAKALCRSQKIKLFLISFLWKDEVKNNDGIDAKKLRAAVTKVLVNFL